MRSQSQKSVSFGIKLTPRQKLFKKVMATDLDINFDNSVICNYTDEELNYLQTLIIKFSHTGVSPEVYSQKTILINIQSKQFKKLEENLGPHVVLCKLLGAPINYALISNYSYSELVELSNTFKRCSKKNNFPFIQPSLMPYLLNQFVVNSRKDYIKNKEFDEMKNALYVFLETFNTQNRLDKTKLAKEILHLTNITEECSIKLINLKNNKKITDEARSKINNVFLNLHEKYGNLLNDYIIWREYPSGKTYSKALEALQSKLTAYQKYIQDLAKTLEVNTSKSEKEETIAVNQSQKKNPKPVLNYIWINRPDENHKDIVHPIKHGRNAINFWCMDEYVDHYKKKFSPYPNIKVIGIRFYLEKLLKHPDPKIVEKATKFKFVYDGITFDGATKAVKKNISISSFCFLNALSRFFILATVGGQVHSTNSNQQHIFTEHPNYFCYKNPNLDPAIDATLTGDWSMCSSQNKEEASDMFFMIAAIWWSSYKTAFGNVDVYKSDKESMELFIESHNEFIKFIANYFLFYSHFNNQVRELPKEKNTSNIYYTWIAPPSRADRDIKDPIVLAKSNSEITVRFFCMEKFRDYYEEKFAQCPNIVISSIENHLNLIEKSTVEQDDQFIMLKDIYTNTLKKEKVLPRDYSLLNVMFRCFLFANGNLKNTETMKNLFQSAYAEWKNSYEQYCQNILNNKLTAEQEYNAKIKKIVDFISPKLVQTLPERKVDAPNTNPVQAPVQESHTTVSSNQPPSTVKETSKEPRILKNRIFDQLSLFQYVVLLQSSNNDQPESKADTNKKTTSVPEASHDSDDGTSKQQRKLKRRKTRGANTVTSKQEMTASNVVSSNQVAKLWDVDLGLSTFQRKHINKNTQANNALAAQVAAQELAPLPLVNMDRKVELTQRIQESKEVTRLSIFVQRRHSAPKIKPTNDLAYDPGSSISSDSDSSDTEQDSNQIKPTIKRRHSF